ncbi:asparagine synthase-related protein [Halobellus limi]|uniref:Asparagine synthase n=1 Tax=Halobellus limi TaxID=699433 RepID=A0A1H6BDP1_9EURY|nr:asparagine synthase-related protein [Halobellus limi]QCC49268.1 asparagine synthase [Halobellus limi]SEG58336.1 asparagine synthase (glutamine-hydrolysing) [Halobellus limi]
MSGICGGEMDSGELADTVSQLDGWNAETRWEYEFDDDALATTSPSIDSNGYTTWSDGRHAGVVYGTVTNLDELGYDERALFTAVLSDPVTVAAELEGEFLIACYDGSGDRHVVVTDKLGARTCFYTADGRFLYSTSMNSLVPLLEDPTVDMQAVNDMLLMGHMWGERTLLGKVRAMRAATVLEVADGERSATRYWKPDYEAHGGDSDGYFDELADRYEQAARRVAGTLPEEAGIWLSGGLDSRTTAAALLQNAPPGHLDRLLAYGYDANPPTEDNPKIASQIARELGIEYSQIPLTAETFAEDIERVIDVTDGMLQWNTTANLSPSYHIERDVPVLMEGVQGELIGDHLLRYHFDESRSIVETQFASEASASKEQVNKLLTEDVDPMRTFKEEAEKSPETTHRGKVLDIHYQNYYARAGLESNRLMRDRTGSRSMQVDGGYLEWCAKMPRYYRKGSFPLSHHVFKSDAGGVPYGTSIAKLELCRRVSPSLSEIRYERTKTKPARPYRFHVAGFVGNVVLSRLQSKATYAGGQLQDFWIRDTDTFVHEWVSQYVGDATDRSFFDADAVESVFERHMNGSNNASMLARITTLEYWLQNHLD